MLALTASGVALIEAVVASGGSALALATSLVLAAIGLAFAVAAVVRSRGHEARAALISAMALMAAVPAVSLIYRSDVGTALAPSIAFLLLLPYLNGRVVFGFAAVSILATAVPEASSIVLGRPASLGLSETVGGTVGMMTASTLLITLTWRIQRSTRAASRRYEDLVSNLPVGIARTTTDGRFVDVNPAYASMLGYPSREALLATPTVQIYADAGSRRPLLDAINGRGQLVADVPLRRLDGSTVWARVRSRALRGERGEISGYDGAIEDITLEREAAATRERLAAIVESAGDAMFSNALDGTILTWNQAAESVYGWSAAEIVGKSVLVLAAPAEQRRVREYLSRASAGKRVGPVEVTRLRRDGRPVTIALIASPLHGPDGRVTGVSVVARDVTEQRTVEARLERLRHERELVVGALRTLRPRGTTELTADSICTEISRAGFGHAFLLGWEAAGTLTFLAGRLDGRPSPSITGVLSEESTRRLREQATTGPWLEDVADGDLHRHAIALAAAGIHAVAYVPIVHDLDPIGFLVVGAPGVDSVRLSERLPALTEFAAISGALLAEGMSERRRRHAARASITSMMEARAFYPVFQPIVDLDTGRVLGFEALTRFCDGRSPDVVFDEAHQAGLGLELEAVTMRAAVDASACLPGDAYLDLNVSPELVLAGEPLRSILASTDRDIVLEVTEHTEIRDYRQFRAAVQGLPTTRLAIDDAGAGFASLRHVAELSPFAVKLDRSLVHRVNVDPARRALVAGMVHFADGIGCTLIAEGIETRAELRALQALGVRTGQGFLLGSPEARPQVRPARRARRRPASVIPFPSAAAAGR